MHFADNNKQNEYQEPSRLFKIFPVIPNLNKFQTLYLPKENTAVDNSLALWKGRLSFRQYIPLKAAKFGIKTFLVYTGKGTELANQFC
jgi:hypothetical protein